MAYPTTKVLVGQFNVCNLVRENTLYYGNSQYTPNEVKVKVKWIANQLAKMQCHVVGFEEIFHQDVLLQAVSQSGIFPSGELVCFADGNGPSVALMSSFPVIEKESIKKFPEESLIYVGDNVAPFDTFQRPVLRAVLQLPNNQPVTFFVLHLKSKRPVVESGDRHDQKKKAIGHALSLMTRAAEATAFRHIYLDEVRKYPNRPVIVLGDLNDVVHSVTTEILSGTAPWKTLPRLAKEEIWNTLLYSTNELQVRQSDRDVTYSHIHNGRYDVLDHVFVSNAFNKANPNHVGYVEQLRMYNDHLEDATVSSGPSEDRLTTDHGQVVAVLKLYESYQAPPQAYKQPVGAASPQKGK
eukprot:TRINITY_DN1551_c0_g1_i1.p1 TRINITY_DN1551_c0_g1~~TRINITY_DN1551_c0_g1_i1.p1  ORF type:complete len:353 (+),score=94.84 TRINITY_DN1551_c0_g1_i1:105-1163(+)